MNNEFALSPSQNRILLAELANPGTTAYNLNFSMRFAYEDESALLRVIPKIMKGNFSLRVRSAGENGYTQYYSGEDAGWETLDLTELDETAVAAKISELKQTAIAPLFDAPLYRLYILRTSVSIILFGVFHHLISDGTTLNLVLPERLAAGIEAVKEGKDCGESGESYREYIRRVTEYLASSESEEDRSYWINELQGFHGPGYKAESLAKGISLQEIPEEITAAWLPFEKEQHISPFVLSLGAVFAYYEGLRMGLGSSAREMVWEISVNGRYFGDDLAHESGMFVETLPLRLSWDGKKSFAELLMDVKAVMKAGLIHARTGSNEYFPELKKQGADLRSLTSFSIVDNGLSGAAAEGGFRSEMGTGSETDVPFHVRVNLNRDNRLGIQALTFEYNSDIFREADILEIRDGVTDVLRQASFNPNICLEELKVQHSRLIASECLVEKNLAAADEPVSLQCGTPRGASFERRMDVVRAVLPADRETLTAGLMALMVRFGMTKEVLIGIRGEEEVLPFGMKLDTSMAAAAFKEEIGEKLKAYEEAWQYPLSCRTDVSFDPCVLLSFAAPSEDSGKEGTAGADITVYFADHSLEIAYDASRYTDKYMASFITALRKLCAAMKSDTPLKEIPLTKSKKEKHRIVLKNEGTINGILERMAMEEPDKTVLTACDRSMTLSELDREASRIGSALIAKGIKHGDRVLLLMRRTSSLVACVFGVLKAGAAFIPMDPNYPKDRISQILEDSEAAIIITDVPEAAEGFSNCISPAELLSGNDERPGTVVTPDDLCFIIYTSGTTGRPKGVALSHRGISNYIAPEAENTPIYAIARRCSGMLCLSSVSFIVFLREIFGTILNGVHVVLCDEEQMVNPMVIAELVKQYGIDALGATPTRLLQYTEIPAFCEALRGIRVMVVGGEGFPGRLFRVIREYSDCEIYNSYGPTEVTIASHQKRMDSERVSAGFPMLNVWDRIADVDGGELPPYAVGELYVGGAGVAIGYFNNEELTASRFPTIDGERYCNTGDLAYRNDTGEVFVLGRNDGMIKLRGLRIELEEIENTLGRYPGVTQARVIVKNIQGTEHLCAFYTVSSGKENITADRLRDFVLEKLPPYMAPTYYTCLEAFPLTPNGKVAMKLLKELPVDTKARAVLERPETDTQKAVFAITASLIESEQFGIRDDLFSLGLTSLSMIALVSEIYEKFGQPIQVTELMKHRTVEGIAQLIDELAAQSPEADSQKHFVKTCPVTANQLGIYFDCTAHPESVGYHLPNVIRFDRSVDPEKLRDAVVKMVNHHPYLKVIFDMQGGEVVQLRDDARPFDVPVEHVSAFTDQMAEELAAQPFGLTGELLFRFKIFVTDEEVALFSLFHHLIVDGGSLNLVFSDIAAAYDGRPLLKEDCDGYRLSEVEKSAEGSAAWAQDIAFFKEQFSVVEEATALTANQKGSEESGSLGVANAEVDIAAVEELCRKYHVSENVVFMSAMAVTLTKFNSDDKLLLATVSNGRLSPMVRNTVALMVKTLPLALKPDRSIKIPELFEYCSGVWMNTLSHQTYPFAKLSGDYDFHPDFFYTYHGKIYEEIELGGRKWKRDRIRYDSLRYKVMLNVIEEDRFIIRAEYNDAIYSADYMQTFVESIGKVIGLWDASENLAGLRICDISLGGEDIEYHFHPLKVEMVHQTFEEMAAAYPDRPILTCRSETYTYDEMNRRANRIAHALMKRGVREGGSVVLLMHRTADLIISMMAVMKAGAAYIPMDVEYPEERVQYVIEDADADLVITEKDLPKAVSVQELLRETDESNPPIRVDGERTAYMIYTSGSTGRPKGVEVSHRNLSNLCVPDPENNYFYTRTPMPESVVQTATVSFDASILDIMPPLLNGMRLIFADDEENRNAEQLTKLIRKEKPAVLGDMTASKLQQFLQSPSFAGELHRFAACAVGGEAFMPALYDKIRSLSDLDIYNSYGPTETTVHSNTRIIQKENIMSVGRGLYNVQCDIRDIDGKVLPDGVVGEHYIGGYGVSKGYHNQPEKTAASFLSIGGVRYFRSGDFAYKLPNGEIVVLGRRDGQIKLRGLRIEIGEIEQSMLAYPDVKAAAVIIRKINRTEHLCGYYTSESDVDEDRFREFLASRLTPYMVPTVLMRLASMPYTPNGKLDRRNLPEPELKRNYVAPCNDVETFFCNVFEEALELEQVGAKDDFFTIGGTSLLAIQVTILASNGGYNIKFRDVFEHPTPRELAEFVSGDTVRSGESNEISDYDYTAIHRYLEGNTFERVLTGERRPLKRILLTGATGFLGSHILRELLEHTDAVVYCLVRSGSMPGAKRLINKLFYYFDNDYADLLGGRLMVVEGEITDAESLKKLEELELDAVYNCAASVKHFSAGTDIFDTNVLGVRNVLMLAEKMNMRMIHISTTSTAGEILLDGRHETFVYDERTLFKGQALDNQYLSSKFLAEREVLAAAARGQDAKVIRVGNLMARDEDGIFQINFQTNGFINRLKAYATLGVMPFDKMLQKLEMSPIDITAQAIVRLAGTPKECSLFNCKNNHTITFGDLLKAANDSGIKIRPVTQDVFREKMDEAMRDKDMQQGIGGLISTVGMGTSAERALTEVSNAYTTMVLFNEGVYWPVITEEYLTSFFEFLNELAFWGKKKQDG